MTVFNCLQVAAIGLLMMAHGIAMLLRPELSAGWWISIGFLCAFVPLGFLGVFLR